jgi:hypothetical protein
LQQIVTYNGRRQSGAILISQAAHNRKKGRPDGEAVARHRLLSMLDLLCISMAREKDFELNLLGLNFGIDFARPALKLPFIGRIGVASTDLASIDTRAKPVPR